MFSLSNSFSKLGEGSKSKIKAVFFSGQCRKFFQILTKKEKTEFAALLVLAMISLVFLTTDFYLKHTRAQPVIAGSFTEGVLGQPRFINPVLAAANDIDRDLTELVFASLMKYTPKGEIVPDLASGYEIKEDGKTWEITLKNNLVFQDNTPLTADDVIFTVKTIQNPDYKSPLRAAWLGIEAEKISDTKVHFILKNNFPSFAEQLTLKIISKKDWEEISPENFPLAIYNLRPTGSGPYKISKILQGQDKSGRLSSLTLTINSRYAGETPKIKEITFVFFDFDKEEDLLKAAKNKQVQALVLPTFGDKDALVKKGFVSYKFDLPRYFAVFFNQKNSPVLSLKEVRQALNYATNKAELVEKIALGNAEIVDSPLLPDLFGIAAPKNTLQFDLKKANDLLDKAGFSQNPNTNIREKTIDKKLSFEFKSRLAKGSQGTEVTELQKCLAKDPEIYPEGETTGVFGDKTRQALIKFQEKYRQDILIPAGLTEGNGETGTLTRKKLNEICLGPKQETLQLKFTLATTDDPLLMGVADLLKKQWAAIGVAVEVKALPFSELNQDFLKPRNYDALLFGEVLGRIPDPFPFWHSLQIKDPGLNLAVYENSDADKLLEQARQAAGDEQRKSALEKFQEVLLNDAPAVFLFRPDFIYLTPAKVKGIATGFITDPSQRFAGIENWYIKVKKVWK